VVGEVWLGSGQSNMSYPIRGYNTPERIVARAQAEAAQLHGAIRYFMVDWNSAAEPQDDVSGKWVVAAPENVGKCSALAWNFGVALQRRLRRPVGLLVTAYGGTPVEAWIPRPELDATMVATAIWRRHQEALSRYRPEQDVKFQADYARWLAANPGDLRDIHASSRPPEPYGPTSRNAPVRLYNGMVHGLEPYTVTGVVWFQADGNQHRPAEYPELIRTLVKTWRRHWGEELPFYYVELNNMYEPQQKPVEERLTLIRDAQNAMLDLPRTGVVSAIDLGVALTAHFPDKKPLGERLANLVLAEIYHLPSPEVHSPEYAGCAMEGSRVRLRFRHAAGLRTRAGTPVKGFAIRGSRGDWLWAEGRIEGEEIVVWNEHLARPAAVRYAWASNPVISVENGAGLPLRPFRTDRDSPL
jgi:sialate O-acetylesterase